MKVTAVGANSLSNPCILDNTTVTTMLVVIRPQRYQNGYGCNACIRQDAVVKNLDAYYTEFCKVLD